MSKNTSEQIVLGSMILRRSLIEKMSQELSPDYFDKSEHRLLFSELIEFDHETDMPGNIDEHFGAFEKWLHEREHYQTVGGIEYIAEIAKTTVSGADAMIHADIVKNEHFKRMLAEIVGRYEKRLRNGSELAELITGLKEEVDKLQIESEVTATPNRSIKRRCFANIQPREIDYLIPEILPLGALVILASQEGDGKSTLAAKWASDISQG